MTTKIKGSIKLPDGCGKERYNRLVTFQEVLIPLGPDGQREQSVDLLVQDLSGFAHCVVKRYADLNPDNEIKTTIEGKPCRDAEFIKQGQRFDVNVHGGGSLSVEWSPRNAERR